MKAKFAGLFLFLPLMFSHIMAQTTAIPDPNFEQFLIDEGYDSNGLTGNILTSDAESVTRLLIFSRNDITDFTGLEAFVNLVELNLLDNQFTTLPLDKLTNLEDFRTRENPILTALDFSNNTALRILRIESNMLFSRPLTTLDLSNNMNLEVLYVENASGMSNITLPVTSTLREINFERLALATIDLGPLDGLEFFKIEYNTGALNILMPNVKNVLQEFAIVGINVSNFDIISEYISLRVLRLIQTGISTLKLPSTDTFENLQINGHDFTSPISFANVPNLKTLQITDAATAPLEIDIRNNPNLTNISLDRNRMTAIDVTQNTKLVSLFISSNNLTTLDISNCVVLEKLSASGNQLNDVDLLQQYHSIRKNNGGLGVSNQLRVSGNNLSGQIPDFTELANEGTSNFLLDFASNRFEFGDFENQHAGYVQMRQNGQINLNSYDYAPQKKVNEIEVLTRNIGETVVLSTTVSGSQNHYKWYKDGNEITNAPDAPLLELANVTSLDEGVYHCEITSDLVPFENSVGPGFNGQNLLLVRNDITLIINIVPPDCITLTMPLDGDTDVPLDTGLQWTPSARAEGYRLSVGTTPGGTDIVNNLDVGTSTSYGFPSALPENTTVYVNIIPYNNAGDATACPEESFLTKTLPTPPDCTTLTMPLDGDTDVPLDTGLQWNPSARAEGYRLSVGTTPGGTDIVNNLDVGTSTSYDFPSALPENTTVYVNIIPYNSAGDATACREESFLTEILPTPPDCTTLTVPLDGDTDVPLDSGLQWNPSASAEGYRLSVGTTPGGTDIVNNLDVGTSTSYDFPSALPENTTVYVNIIPYNSAGDTTACPEESFLTEILPTPPDCTTLTMPLDGDTDVPLDTGLQWNPSASAEGYRLSVGTTPGGTDIVNNLDVGTSTSYGFPSALPENTTVYVNIIPYNSAGDATACPEESFLTETLPTPPDCTTLTVPLDGDTDVPLDTGLQWNPSASAEGYRLSVGTTPGGTDIVNNLDVGTSTTYGFPSALPENTTVYVSIIPYNSAGDATACREESFLTKTLPTPPDCTTLTMPLDGDTDVPLDTGLQWTPSERAEGYRLSVGTTPGGTDIVNNLDVGTSTSYGFPSALPENTTVYVNIIPYNSAGDATACRESIFITEVISFLNKTKYGISPNGDGINDYWEISDIEAYPDNSVSIFNRWGNLVFETNGYDNINNVFTGNANRSSSLGGGKLPEGTYFYIITLNGLNNQNKLQGFLVLKR